MKRPLRNLLSPAALASAALLAVPGAGALASAGSPGGPPGSTSQLPESSYTIQRPCGEPSIGQAVCLAERLVPATAQARAYNHPIGVVRPAGAAQPAKSPAAGDFGLRPQDIHSAYSLPAEATGEPLIALVDAYNDPTAEADLERYEETFSLAGCKTSCFTQVNQKGQTGPANMPFPKTLKELEKAEAGSEAEKEEAEEAIGWGVEEALDVESARATCPNCKLLLVEADSSSYEDLEEAVRTAESMKAVVISNSWGGPEAGVSSDATFNDPNTVITASSGDDGYLGWDRELGFTNYPAASPHVVAVGGTRLTLGAGGSWLGEKVWNDAGGVGVGYGASGGGCSIKFTAPAWQQATSEWSGVGCGTKRSVVDVAADGDPYSGIAVTATNPECETEEPGEAVPWCTYGGTSLASPIIAGVFALAGGANGVAYPAQTLYESRRHAPGTLHDVTVGSNGRCTKGIKSNAEANCTSAEEASSSCSGHRTCLASKGYDGPSGVGTPDGMVGFQPGASEPGAEEEPEEKTKSEPPVETPPPVHTATVTTPPPPPAPVNKVVKLSRLALAVTALTALNRAHPSIAKIAFTFEMTLPASVRATLVRQVVKHHHKRWVAVGRALTIAATAGRNSKHLSGSTHLARGLYKLTLTPAGAAASSLLIHIG